MSTPPKPMPPPTDVWAGPSAACAFAVMAKASTPGRTKTRLVPPLTFAEAAAFNTAFLRDMAAKMLLAGRETAVAPFMAFGPAGAESFFRSILPDAVGLVECCDPDFGRCLLGAVAHLLDAGHGAACLVNADGPTLPAAHLVEAARVLAEPGDRMVFGPATDGGYYLIGLKRPHARLFQGIAWSTEAVAGQTLERAREIGLPVHMLPAWYDVDDAASLRQLIADLPDAGETAAATAALVQRLDAEADLTGRLASAGTAA